jgi:hypothetical protein
MALGIVIRLYPNIPLDEIGDLFQLEHWPCENHIVVPAQPMGQYPDAVH